MTPGQKAYAALVALRPGGKPWPPAASPFGVGVIACLNEQFALQAKERRKAAIIPEAEQIYEAYPTKIGREDALRAISKALKSHPLSYLLDKTHQFAQAVKSWPSSYRYFQDGGDRCPHPATWFNAGRYADDPAEWKRHGARHAAPSQYLPPPEPQGWKDAFPDFVDRDKPWHLLQSSQHAYIVANMATVHHFSEPVEMDEQETRLRNA